MSMEFLSCSEWFPTCPADRDVVLVPPLPVRFHVGLLTKAHVTEGAGEVLSLHVDLPDVSAEDSGGHVGVVTVRTCHALKTQ